VEAPSPASAPEAKTTIFEPVVDPRERFQQEAKANLMECLAAVDPAASAQILAQVLDSLPPGEIFVQDDPILRRMLEASRLARPIRWSSQGAPNEGSQATVTLARALIAQTGSVFVTAACGGRGASVVAPCHIVFATSDQLVPDLETALVSAAREAVLASESFACVISGSSRTADIEKILVQGAHGPRRLVVILEERH
jgi:L-lactate dehydrogenase complex protein LldG